MNYAKKDNYRKPRRDNKKPSNYYQNDDRDEPRPRPNNNNNNSYKKPYRNEREDNTYVYKKRPNIRAEVYIYKQDLIQRGLEVAAERALKPWVQDVVDQFSECMVGHKRKVIVQTYNDEESYLNKSKVTHRDDIREDFEELMDNEEIPDWFIDDGPKNEKVGGFDFGATVSRTLKVNKEIVSIVNEGARDRVLPDDLSIIDEREDFKMDELDFNKLDNYLENKMKNTTRMNESFDDAGLYGEESDDEYANQAHHEKDDNDSQQEGSSRDNSKLYFNNLEQNIKDMLFNNVEEEDEESEESFEESLGFDNYKKTPAIVKVDPQPVEPKPIEVVQNKVTQEVKTQPPAQMPVAAKPAVVTDSDPVHDVLRGFDLASHIAERKKVSKEEREMKRKYFMQKYGYMDPIICQIVYEILNSKKRDMLNKNSANGFNQKSVQKFSANKYKIFSMFMQGNIISKVWLYKDRNNAIQGPYMSYDMDIWNNEENVFTEDMLIALGTGPFLPLLMYVDRDPIVVEIVENFFAKSQAMSENANNNKKKRGYNNNNNNYNNYNRQQNTQYVPKGTNNAASHNSHAPVSTSNTAVQYKESDKEKQLNDKYQENFPSLGTTTANKWDSPAPKKEAPLLDILRGGHNRNTPKTEVKAPVKTEDKSDKARVEAHDSKQDAQRQSANNQSDTKQNKVAGNETGSGVNIVHKKQPAKNQGKGKKEQAYTRKDEEKVEYVEKKVEKKGDSNAELTSNLKNLLGL